MTIQTAFGFKLHDYSKAGARQFWATVSGESQIPFTVHADRDDVEDYAMGLDDCQHYVTPGRFIRALGHENYEQLVYMFVDHLLQQEQHKDCLKMKLIVMGLIMDIIAPDAGDPVTEFYSHSGYRIAGYTLNLFARRTDVNTNYSNQWGSYRVWIESDFGSITNIPSLLALYCDIIKNHTLRRLPN